MYESVDLGERKKVRYVKGSRVNHDVVVGTIVIVALWSNACGTLITLLVSLNASKSICQCSTTICILKPPFLTMNVKTQRKTQDNPCNRC
jgi:hypothetical protein